MTVTGRVPKRSAAQPAGYRIAPLAKRPAAKTAPTSAAEPPFRPRKIGSSGRKNHTPIAVSRLAPYKVNRVRRCMSIGNTGRALTSDGLQEIVWDLIPASPQTAHMHMALDEVVLERVIAGERRPTVRFWKWIERTLVIGSHQSVMNEVDDNAARRLGFTVTRRMTGGGTMLCEPERTITYSLYLPGTAVAGMSFRRSYAVLDAWAVRAFNGLGIPASYREINDIISPRGKIAGAAQARRRGFVLHHTTIAHTMDPNLVPRLIRVGRDRLSERGVRSAEKPVSPLSWFTSTDCAGVARHMERSFASDFHVRKSEVTTDELDAARELESTKYATAGWINRVP